MKAKLIKTEVNYILEDDNGVVIASTSLNKEGLSLSIKNCQAIENGYDLDELLNNISPNNGTNGNISERIGFFKGFKKCLERVGDKKFSEEDVISMIEKSRETGLTAQYLILTKQQKEWDVKIEKENVMNDYNGNISLGARYKLDSDGCLILKSFKSE